MRILVAEEDLHRFVVTDCSQTECCVAALGTFESGATGQEIARLLEACGLHGARTWNISRALKKAGSKVAHLKNQWSLTASGRDWIGEVGLYSSRSPVHGVSNTMRKLLEKIDDEETRRFVEEAVVGLEHNLRRSAVVMSWLAAVHVLKTEVFINHRDEFDQEMLRIDPSWKKVKSLDDYGRIKESEFLHRISALSIVGKNVKTELIECLNRRNACGHPNSYESYAGKWVTGFERAAYRGG